MVDWHTQVDALLAADHISAPNSGQPESQEATLNFSK
jgi:hypothetical protein